RRSVRQIANPRQWRRQTRSARSRCGRECTGMKTIPRRLRAVAQASSLSDNRLLSRHQAFIRALPCVACSKPPPSERAQVGFHRGIGWPNRARHLLPLCGPASVWDDCCHSQKHFLGAARFWSALGIDPISLALRLWQVSGDVAAGEQEAMRLRAAITAPSQRTRERPRDPDTHFRTERSYKTAWMSTLPAAVGPNQTSRESAVLSGGGR